MLHPLYENKNYENLNMRKFLALVTFDLCHTQSLALLQMSLYWFFAKASNPSLTVAAQVLL